MCLQQDNAPAHCFQTVTEWLDEHSTYFRLLAWLPRSPDLNPIERICNVVDSDMCIVDLVPTDLGTLWEAVQARCDVVARPLASHQGERGSLPRGAAPDFRTWESCQAMSLVGGFSRGSHTSTPPPPRLLNSDAAPYSPHFIPIGSEDVDVKARWRSGILLDSHHGGHGFDSRPGLSDFGFPWFSQITPDECWDESMTRAMADSFPILPQSLFLVQIAPPLITSLSTRQWKAGRQGVEELLGEMTLPERQGGERWKRGLQTHRGAPDSYFKIEIEVSKTAPGICEFTYQRVEQVAYHEGERYWRNIRTEQTTDAQGHRASKPEPGELPSCYVTRSPSWMSLNFHPRAMSPSPPHPPITHHCYNPADDRHRPTHSPHL
ncbi:hypothetical protein PR048_011843 [Dryococelus australis]|uniref:Tc1-like transposase DDE domain-containing protein n=1 Tax=Dryococelus australis TaxID=614101 RepID=A0ABQ9HMN4_9NEOP|nr:hypothetical protein PR048_011843 [Dryococelus australis]